MPQSSDEVVHQARDGRPKPTPIWYRVAFLLAALAVGSGLSESVFRWLDHSLGVTAGAAAYLLVFLVALRLIERPCHDAAVQR